MARTYDAKKKSDMKRFRRDMKEAFLQEAQHAAQVREQEAAQEFLPQVLTQRVPCKRCGKMNEIPSFGLLDLPIRCSCGYEIFKRIDADVGTGGDNAEEAAD